LLELDGQNMGVVDFVASSGLANLGECLSGSRELADDRTARRGTRRNVSWNLQRMRRPEGLRLPRWRAVQQRPRVV